jgi:hypothetical protein
MAFIVIFSSLKFAGITNSFPEKEQEDAEKSISLVVSGRHDPFDILPSTLM